MLYKFVQTKESPCEGACLYLEGLDVIGNWACLVRPFEDRQDGEGYTLGKGLVDCSLLGFVDLLGHGGVLFCWLA